MGLRRFRLVKSHQTSMVWGLRRRYAVADYVTLDICQPASAAAARASTGLLWCAAAGVRAVVASAAASPLAGGCNCGRCTSCMGIADPSAVCAASPHTALSLSEAQGPVFPEALPTLKLRPPAPPASEGASSSGRSTMPGIRRLKASMKGVVFGLRSSANVTGQFGVAGRLVFYARAGRHNGLSQQELHIQRHTFLEASEQRMPPACWRCLGRICAGIACVDMGHRL